MAKRHTDPLGLHPALEDWMLPVLVAAMSFLAALAVAGALASAVLAAQWQNDTAAALTIQVPQPGAPDAAGNATRLAAVQAALQTMPGVTNPQPLSAEALNRLLVPWLGTDAAALGLPLPAVITATWSGPGAGDAIGPALEKLAPGTLAQSGTQWAAHVTALTGSLQTCAAAVLVIVALVGAALVALATRSGLAQRRDTIETIHGLGAQDGDIASRFAGRATILAVAGAAAGALLALPVLLWLAVLAAPFAGPLPAAGLQHGLAGLPPALWTALPCLPLAAAVIGWSSAQLTVRGWLRKLV
jgi:cell division transport system permease protein